MDSNSRTWKPRSAIAVLGGSTVFTKEQIEGAFRVGEAIAKRGMVLLTGATSGVPYAAALGAHHAGGLVVGVSPAADAIEHATVYKKSTSQADLLIYSGLGRDMRSALMLRSAAGGVFIGGEFGTLGEFCSAWQGGGSRVWGLLEGCGGLSAECGRLLQLTETKWSSEILQSAVPEDLVNGVCDRVEAINLTGATHSNDDPTAPTVHQFLADVLGRTSR